MHFICIDKRVKDPNTGKTYIIMDNGEKIILPENIQSVPAVLLLSDNYKVLYGDDIYNHFRPQVQEAVVQSTQGNMEPSSFSFGGAGESMGMGVSSDNYSFLDMGSDDLGTKGGGGTRQMHNYVGLQGGEHTSMQAMSDQASVQGQGTTQGQGATQGQGQGQGTTQGGGGGQMTMEQLQSMRDQDFQQMSQQQRRV